MTENKTSSIDLNYPGKQTTITSESQHSNKIRTNLLLLALKDFKSTKENSQTKINSLSIIEAEKQYSKQNDCSVNLKPEMTFSTFSSRKGVHQVRSQENLNPVFNQFNNLSSNYLNAEYNHFSSSGSFTGFTGFTNSPIRNKNQLQNNYNRNNNQNISAKSIISTKSNKSIKLSSSSVSSSEYYSSSNSSHYGYLPPLKIKTSLSKKKLEYFTHNLISSYDLKKNKNSNIYAKEKDKNKNRNYNNINEVIIIPEDSPHVPINLDTNKCLPKFDVSVNNKKRADASYKYLQNLAKNLKIIKKKKRKSKISGLESLEFNNTSYCIIKNDMSSQISHELTNDTNLSTNTLKYSDIKENLISNNKVSHSQFIVSINGLTETSENENNNHISYPFSDKSQRITDKYKQYKPRKESQFGKNKVNKEEILELKSDNELQLELLRDLESQSQKSFKISPCNKLIKKTKNLEYKNE